MQQTQIVVWDALMSSGKTNKIIDYMVSANMSSNLMMTDNDYFMYVSPYLSEAHRISATVSEGEAQTPKLNEDGSYAYLDEPQAALQFKHPNNKNKDGSKLTGLMSLIDAKHNVVSTHTLLNSLKPESLEQCKDYTLVIDEALIAYEADYTLNIKTVNQYLEINILSLKEDGYTLQFNRENFGRYNTDDPNYDCTKNTEVEQFARDCDRGLLYKFNSKIIRKFDANILTKFKKVIIMTYMFKGSMFDLLIQQAGLDVEIEYFGKRIEDIAPLITINQDRKMNSVGDYGVDEKGLKHMKKFTLTSNHFKKERNKKQDNYNETNNKLYNHLFNMWQQREKIEPERRLWTCFGDDKLAISKGKGKTNRFSSKWIAFNTRATNDYMSADHLAFLVNVFIDNNFIKASSVDGIKLSQDHYATSILVQWLFRSAIRNNQPVDLYIPSERMRNLLQSWLDGNVPTYYEAKELPTGIKMHRGEYTVKYKEGFIKRDLGTYDTLKEAVEAYNNFAEGK